MGQQVSCQSAGEAFQLCTVGLEGDVGRHAESERRYRRGNLFIMADCLSMCFSAPIHCVPLRTYMPTMGFKSLPIRM